MIWALDSCDRIHLQGLIYLPGETVNIARALSCFAAFCRTGSHRINFFAQIKKGIEQFPMKYKYKILRARQGFCQENEDRNNILVKDLIFDFEYIILNITFTVLEASPPRSN